MPDYEQKLRNLNKIILYFIVVFIAYLLGRIVGESVPLYEFILPIALIVIVIVLYRHWLKWKLRKNQEKKDQNPE